MTHTTEEIAAWKAASQYLYEVLDNAEEVHGLDPIGASDTLIALSAFTQRRYFTEGIRNETPDQVWSAFWAENADTQ